MQFKLVTAILLACTAAMVSAAPVPVEIPPLDVESRDILGREIIAEAAREATPEPICGKYGCM